MVKRKIPISGRKATHLRALKLNKVYKSFYHESLEGAGNPDTCNESEIYRLFKIPRFTITSQRVRAENVKDEQSTRNGAKPICKKPKEKLSTTNVISNNLVNAKIGRSTANVTGTNSVLKDSKRVNNNCSDTSYLCNDSASQHASAYQYFLQLKKRKRNSKKKSPKTKVTNVSKSTDNEDKNDEEGVVSEYKALESQNIHESKDDEKFEENTKSMKRLKRSIKKNTPKNKDTMTCTVSSKIPLHQRMRYRKLSEKIKRRLKTPNSRLRRTIWNTSAITRHLKYNPQTRAHRRIHMDSEQSKASIKSLGNCNSEVELERNNDVIISERVTNENVGKVLNGELDTGDSIEDLYSAYGRGPSVQCDMQKTLDDTRRYENETFILRSFVVERGVVVVTDFPELVLKGKARLRLLWGVASVLGFRTCAADGREIQIFSPTCTSQVTIKKAKATNRRRNDRKRFLETLSLSESETAEVESLLDADVIAFLLRELDCSACSFVAGIRKYSGLFAKSFWHGKADSLNENLRLARVDAEVFPPKNCTFPVMVETEFCMVADKWDGLIAAGKSVLISGGKDSGKSTLARYLVNSSLSRFPAVCYLDCDVGQTEFSPPGCISLHTLTEPVIGPPFTHQRTPIFACYYGAVTPSNDPYFYIACLKAAYDHYTSLEPRPPLVINTLGFNRGLGLRLLVDIIHITQPDLVAQLICMEAVKNSPYLVPDFISRSPGWTHGKQSPVQFTHDVITVKSFVTEENVVNEILRLKPKDFRDLSLLANFCPLVRSGFYDSLLSARPLKVSWTKVALHVSHERISPIHVLAAFNGVVVALCHADLDQAEHVDGNPEWPLVFIDKPANTYIASGIVRAIDMNERCLYVVTPAPLSALSTVNTLIKGADNIPEAIALSRPRLVEGSVHLPYTGPVSDTVGAFTVETIAEPKRHFLID